MAEFKPLSAFANNIHSQFGEDGILAEIIARLGLEDEDRPKWCVEFGAWDGMHLSNTYNLISNHGWHAVLIEADENRYKDLCENIPSDKVVKICQFVGFDEKDCLDAILGSTDIPTDCDLLSIDVDGCDYHIWESLTRYKPKIICVEHNPSIPVDIAYVQPRNFSVQHGNGVKALDNLAIEKGYTTVAVTDTNMIAVRNDFLEKVVGNETQTIEDFADGSMRRFLFLAYDGTVLSNSHDRMQNWHGLKLTIDDFQIVPRYLRTFPENYSFLQRIAFNVFRFWHNMRHSIRKVL